MYVRMHVFMYVCMHVCMHVQYVCIEHLQHQLCRQDLKFLYVCMYAYILLYKS